jgi:hypothetical protein
MAEHQLPKLTVRVRFPSPAPRKTAGQRLDRRDATVGSYPMAPVATGTDGHAGSHCPRRSISCNRRNVTPPIPPAWTGGRALGSPAGRGRNFMHDLVEAGVGRAPAGGDRKRRRRRQRDLKQPCALHGPNVLRHVAVLVGRAGRRAWRCGGPRLCVCGAAVESRSSPAIVATSPAHLRVGGEPQPALFTGDGPGAAVAVLVLTYRRRLGRYDVVLGVVRRERCVYTAAAAEASAQPCLFTGS